MKALRDSVSSVSGSALATPRIAPRERSWTALVLLFFFVSLAACGSDDGAAEEGDAGVSSSDTVEDTAELSDAGLSSDASEAEDVGSKLDSGSSTDVAAAKDVVGDDGGKVEDALGDVGELDASADVVVDVGTGPCAGLSIGASCDDGDPCTDKDACDADGACVGQAALCDDGDECTTDSCLSASGCAHSPIKAGQPCKVEDKCVIGYTCAAPPSNPGGKLVCQGGKKVDCDDVNFCTDDSCQPSTGCVHKLTDKPCDDGESCTSSDSCVGGLCMGLKTASCPKCTQSYKLPTAQVTSFKVGLTGKVGDGLDVDGDPQTCAPKGKCDQGIDNAFASVGGLVNIPLSQAIEAGQFTFVAEFKGYKGEGKPFTLNMYYAELTPKSAAAKCPYLTKTCTWYVSQSALGPDCKPKVSFVDAKVVGGKLSAGSQDTLFVMDVVGSGGMALLYVKGAHLKGEVKFAADGVTIVSVKGVIGGAMDKNSFIQVINGMPDAVFPVPKANIVGVMDKTLKPDIDFDGDGIPEAASIGLRFEAIHAWIDGTQP